MRAFRKHSSVSLNSDQLPPSTSPILQVHWTKSPPTHTSASIRQTTKTSSKLMQGGDSECHISHTPALLYMLPRDLEQGPVPQFRQV